MFVPKMFNQRFFCIYPLSMRTMRLDRLWCFCEKKNIFSYLCSSVSVSLFYDHSSWGLVFVWFHPHRFHEGPWCTRHLFWDRCVWSVVSDGFIVGVVDCFDSRDVLHLLLRKGCLPLGACWLRGSLLLTLSWTRF